MPKLSWIDRDRREVLFMWMESARRTAKSRTQALHLQRPRRNLRVRRSPVSEHPRRWPVVLPAAFCQGHGVAGLGSSSHGFSTYCERNLTLLPKGVFCALAAFLPFALTRSGLFFRSSRMKMKVAKQGGTGGSSASQRTSTGSGSRPGGGKMTIPSSAPASAQMIRPKNKIGS